MVGETVTVRTRKQTGVDRYNNAVWADVDETVGNVLVSPGATTDALESTRPDGVTIDYTLYFPKSYTGTLDHGQVCVRGEWLYVVGAPRPYDLVNCPTSWCMVVEVTRTNG